MDSIPLMAKWMTAVQTNKTASRDCIIDSATVEYLAVNHQYAPCMYVCAADDVQRGVTDCRGLLGHPCSMVRACALGRERLTCVCRTIGPGTAGSNLYIETDQAHGTQLNWLTDPHATNDWEHQRYAAWVHGCVVVVVVTREQITFSSSYALGPGAHVSPNVSSNGYAQL